jgi:AcrR family transcriptional regulator
MKSKDEIAKEEIIVQAQKLFMQYGLKKTTMDEIAEACDKAKSTLYHYFKNKEHIFDEVIHLELLDLRNVVKEQVDSKNSVTLKLTTYFLEFHKEIINRTNLYRIVKNELINEKKSIQIFNQLLIFETSYISKVLHDSYDSGEYTDICIKDIPWFAESLLAGFFGIVRYTIESDSSFEIEKMERISTILISKIFG